VSNTPIYDEVAEYLGDPFGVVDYSIALDDSPWRIFPGTIRHVNDDMHDLQASLRDALCITVSRYLPSEETNMQMNGNPADQGPESFTTGENPIVAVNHIPVPETAPVDLPDMSKYEADDEGTDRQRLAVKILRDPKLSDHIRQGWSYSARNADDDDLVAEDGRGIRVWWHADGSFYRAKYFFQGLPCAMHAGGRRSPYDNLVDAVLSRTSWVYPLPMANHPPVTEADQADAYEIANRVLRETPTSIGSKFAPERLAYLIENPSEATPNETARGFIAIRDMEEMFSSKKMFAYPASVNSLGRPGYSIDDVEMLRDQWRGMGFVPGQPTLAYVDSSQEAGTVLDGLVRTFPEETSGELHPEPVDDGKFVNPGAALAERQARESTEEARQAAPKVGVMIDGELHFEQNQGSPMGAFTKPQVSEQVAQKIADRVSSLKAHVDRIIGVSDPVTDDGELPSEPTDSTTPEKSVLDEAAATISTGRVDDYGQAEDSFGVIASFWGTYLSARLGTPVTIDGWDVAQMMNLLKTARDTQSRKRDNLVDGAGYLALAERAVSSDR